SGVQGGAEVGAVPNVFPGGRPVTPENAQHFAEQWGFAVPSTPGLKAAQMIDAAYDGDLDVLYCSGGNFLDVLPDPDYVHEALGTLSLRVHQDIYLTTQMLVDPADTVVLLPAQTRYEQRGGGTETSTERRIIFSPEIAGPRPGEARCEWEIFAEVAARVAPEKDQLITFRDVQVISEEIARVNPTYAGIEMLRKAGDQVQYGGRILYEGGQFKTPDGKGRFSALTPPELGLPEGKFILSTRRGKQFNSMIYRKVDPLTGAGRDALLLSAEDAAALGVANGDRVEVRSDNGASMQFRVRIDQIKPRNVQAFWPEANPWIRRRVCAAASGIPDYNAIVAIVPVRAAEPVSVAGSTGMGAFIPQPKTGDEGPFRLADTVGE